MVDPVGRAWVDMPGSLPWEEPRPGIVAVVLPDGTSRQVAQDLWFPNGMAVMGDETLVVAESHADRLTAWTMTDGGDLVDRRVWADLGSGSALDGICADAEGTISYASVPRRCCERVAPGGEILDSIEVDRGCFACMLGGDDGLVLYIVANHYSGGGASDGIVLTHRVGVPTRGVAEYWRFVGERGSALTGTHRATTELFLQPLPVQWLHLRGEARSQSLSCTECSQPYECRSVHGQGAVRRP